MFCPNCGAPNDESATQCGSCGTYLNQQAAAPAPAMAGGYPSSAPVAPVPNHLVPAILTTLFCCMPLGIVSIIFATQVNSKAAAGDYVGAQAASQKAKTWAMVGFISGLVVQVLYFFAIIASEM